MNGVQTHNINGDRHRLHKLLIQLPYNHDPVILLHVGIESICVEPKLHFIWTMYSLVVEYNPMLSLVFFILQILALFIIYFNIHFIIIFISLDLTPEKIVFVVLSQPNSFHANRAEEFRKHFIEQLDSIDKVSTCVPI